MVSAMLGSADSFPTNPVLIVVKTVGTLHVLPRFAEYSEYSLDFSSFADEASGQ